MSLVAKVRFVDYETSVHKALDAIQAAELLPQDQLIVLKPNLTTNSPPPVTTPVACVAAALTYCRKHTQARVVIGEGCGGGVTRDIYESQGYVTLAEKYGVDLVDFNDGDAVEVSHPDALQLKTFMMPRILQDAFVISIPILKDHSFTRSTIAMKNMFGIAPEPYYGGSWNKSQLHSPSTDISVHDLCLYKRPAISLVDARVALTGMHLSGTPKTFNLILASCDCVAVDAVGSELLGHDPHSLEYLRVSDGTHGDMNRIEIVEG